VAFFAMGVRMKEIGWSSGNHMINRWPEQKSKGDGFVLHVNVLSIADCPAASPTIKPLVCPCMTEYRHQLPLARGHVVTDGGVC
jgi:hypothetical protein